MTTLAWDQVGQRRYEAGVDHGVLYVPDNNGNYDTAAPWNGLTTVTESPSGADSSPQYADNIKYLNLVGAEQFGATIEAFTYPDLFAECDGTAQPEPGVALGQQGRRIFGLSYRTRVGNDLQGTEHGYKIHLLYGCQAAPSEKAYGTLNDSPEAISFSWELSTSPVPVTGFKPTALLTLDSTQVNAAALASVEDILYGTDAVDARLPLPDEVLALFAGTTAEVRMTGANAPAYNAATHVVTIPAVGGVTWTLNGEPVDPGAQPALAVGETAVVEAHATDGYELAGDDDWTYDY